MRMLRSCLDILKTRFAMNGVRNGGLLAVVALFISCETIPLTSVERKELEPGSVGVGRLFSVDRTDKVLALTFDDGPHPVLTAALLDLLKEEGVPATFFVTGRNATAFPELIRRMVDEGHEVENHSWTHRRFTELSDEEISEEIISTNKAIMAAAGKKSLFFRPPYGALREDQEVMIYDKFRLRVAMWSVDPKDWKRPGVAEVERRMVAGAQPGAVILAHDIHPGTIDAMPGVIRQLKAKGYGFKRLDDLVTEVQ